MKHWKFLSLAVLISASALLIGCSSDDDDPIDLGPTINLKTGEGYTSADFEVVLGTTLKFGVIANKSTTSDNYLARFNILFGNLTIIDTVINVATFNTDYEIQFASVGTAKMIFRITAQGGMTDEVELNATTTEPPFLGVEVKKTTNIELGSYNDPIGSFYNTLDEMVYTISEAKLNQEKVDFLFFKGATNLNALAAPDDDDANSIPTFQLNEWTIKNQTRFNYSNMTAAEFDEIGELHIFAEFDIDNALPRVSELEVGQIVMFRTVTEKLGYIKVLDTYTKGDKIKIDVIVEK
jgi:hypothetical protein